MVGPSPATIDYAELLLEEGKKKEARLLLAAYLKRNPASVHAWWVVSQAVDTPAQERDCLERLLRIDPTHQQARARLEALDAPPPALASPPTPVSPFVYSPEELESREEFDLFQPGAFEAAAEEAARQGYTPTSAPPPPPVTPKSEVPAWAEPPAPKGKAAPPARKKRTWVVDVVIISSVLCLLLMVVGYFIFSDMAKGLLPDFQETRQVAQALTSRPPNTLEPTWTASLTLTLPPTETPAPTSTVPTPSPEPTSLYTRTSTPIPPGAIGVTVGLFPPPFTLVDSATGAGVSLDQFPGRPVLLFFWAGFCPYCRAEIQDLKDLQANYQDDGLVILGINGGDSASEVEAYRQSYGIQFPLLLDGDNAISLRYQAYSIPHHVFIGVSGRIMYVSTGQMYYDELASKVEGAMRVFPTSTP